MWKRNENHITIYLRISSQGFLIEKTTKNTVDFLPHIVMLFAYNNNDIDIILRTWWYTLWLRRGTSGESMMRMCSTIDSKYLMCFKKLNSRRVFERVDADIREFKTTGVLAVFVSSCDGPQQANQHVLGKLSKKKEKTAL